MTVQYHVNATSYKLVRIINSNVEYGSLDIYANHALVSTTWLSQLESMSEKDAKHEQDIVYGNLIKNTTEKIEQCHSTELIRLGIVVVGIVLIVCFFLIDIVHDQIHLTKYPGCYYCNLNKQSKNDENIPENANASVVKNAKVSE